jgi:hypothetical protein
VDRGLRYFGGAVAFGFAAVWITWSLAAALVCLLSAAAGYGAVFVAQCARGKLAAAASSPTPASRTPEAEDLSLQADLPPRVPPATTRPLQARRLLKSEPLGGLDSAFMMVNGPSGQATSGSTSGKGSGALPDTRGGEGWVIDGEILCGLLEEGEGGSGRFARTRHSLARTRSAGFGSVIPLPRSPPFSPSSDKGALAPDAGPALPSLVAGPQNAQPTRSSSATPPRPVTARRTATHPPPRSGRGRGRASGSLLPVQCGSSLFRVMDNRRL